MKKYLRRYPVGFLGAALWGISWVFGLGMNNHLGGVLMLITGGLGYLLMFGSLLLPV
jgi:hypothetical protein